MEVTASQLIDLLREGTAPRKARAAIARGTLPLPPAVLLESLDILADDPDDAIRTDALGSLERLPETLVRGVASSPATGARLLGRLALRYRQSESVAVDIARNTAADDATTAALAALPHPTALEIIGRNQARLERSPEVVAALIANPQTPTAIIQLWQEHEARKTALLAMDAAQEQDGDSAAAGPVFDRVLVEDEDEQGVATPARLPDGEAGEVFSARQLSIYAMLKKMSMGQKVALAVKGNREVRNLLIRENNRMLCLKVLDNPRLSEGDVESYAKSTNISVDVLRGIANKKEWCKKLPIAKALVTNPRTPLGISLEFIKRLTKKDLEQLAKNRNVAEALRSTARRMFMLKRDANQQ